MNMIVKLADSNNATALYQLGNMYDVGDDDSKIKKDMGKAAELLHRAAKLGSASATAI
jgi:TPR repeat protein